MPAALSAEGHVQRGLLAQEVDTCLFDDVGDSGDAQTGWFKVASGYDPALVTLSVLIAAFGGYTALQLADRIGAPGMPGHRLWLASAAFAMGGGIWSMHFVGMLALRSPVPITYELARTALSLLVAVVATGGAFFWVSRSRARRRDVLVAGLFMGGAIAGMHYLGMSAMRMPVPMSFVPARVLLSIAIAVAASTAGLSIALRRHRIRTRFLAALMLGMAVAGMHYTGMWAAGMGMAAGHLSMTAAAPDGAVGPEGMVFGVVTATFAVLLLALLAATASQLRAQRLFQGSEARFQAFAQILPNHIWTATPAGEIDWANDRAYAYSRTSAIETVGDGWSERVHPDDLPLTRERWAVALANGTPYEAEFRLRRADGAYRWHLARALPVTDTTGTVVRWMGTNTDIEDQKSTAAALAHLNATLEERVVERTRALEREQQERLVAEEKLRQAQKMEAVGQLTGGLAHDFNNLLAGISGNLEMLEARLTQGRYGDLTRYLGAAQGATRRAAALTHRLLAFSRRQTLAPTPTRIDRLIADMEELIRRTVGPEITVEVVGTAGLWLALVDPNQLENALLNLCINARDAMPGGGRITIETANKWLDARAAGERELSVGQYLAICVTDSGTGMTPDVIAHAFDPFFTTKPTGQGTGLGLSMIYGFARQSGGQVRIYSEPGQGTTVCLYLPRHHGAAGDAVDVTIALPLTAQTGTGETVVVVDDEPTVRMLVVEMLEDLGYIALEASDGPAGLKLLQSGVPVDLLITDVGLPGGINGRQLADAARLTRPALKVLFITGYAESAIIGHGHLDPGMHVVTKPFVMRAFAERVKSLIEADKSIEAGRVRPL